MKKLLFGLIATVMFCFAGNAQDIETLKSSNNPFNEIGESSFNFLIELSNLSQEEKSTREDLDNKIKNSDYNQKLKISDQELETYKSYFTENTFTLKNIIEFENYILKKELPYNKENLLKSVSLLKWNMFFIQNSSNFVLKSGPRPKGQTFEGCLNYCMEKKLYAIENGNWIDQAEFVLGQPYNTAWMVASCSWDCR